MIAKGGGLRLAPGRAPRRQMPCQKSGRDVAPPRHLLPAPDGAAGPAHDAAHLIGRDSAGDPASSWRVKKGSEASCRASRRLRLSALRAWSAQQSQARPGVRPHERRAGLSSLTSCSPPTCRGSFPTRPTRARSSEPDPAPLLELGCLRPARSRRRVDTSLHRLLPKPAFMDQAEVLHDGGQWIQPTPCHAGQHQPARSRPSCRDRGGGGS